MAGYCSSCGAALTDGAAFCGKCGSPVGAAAAPAAPAVPPPPQAYAPPTQPSGNSPALPWIIVAVIAVAIALAAVFFATRGNDGTANSDVGDSATPAGEAGGAAVMETPVGPVVTKFVASPANIRNVPTAQGPDSRVLSTLRRGTQVSGQMVSGPGNAYWLKLSDGRGYVSAINLSDGPAAVQPVEQARAPVIDGVYCSVAIRSGNLRIRAAPAGRIVGGLPRGARFQMYGDPVYSSGYYWVQIQPADGRFFGGWVASDHIRC